MRLVCLAVKLANVTAYNLHTLLQAINQSVLREMAAIMNGISSCGNNNAKAAASEAPQVSAKDSAKVAEKRIDQVKLLEINEAIRDLDGRLSDLEAALHIANDKK